MSPTWAVVAAVLVLAGIAAWVTVAYNRFVAQRQAVTAAWATVDAELQRRHELIPGLVEAVRAAVTHERATITRLTDARAAAVAAAATPPTRAGPEHELTVATQAVLALREVFPVLRADRAFLALQDQLALTEDRIAASRRFYNTRVLELNHRVQAFPSRLVARAGGFTEAEFFEI